MTFQSILKQAKKDIRSFIQGYWTDQKLLEVYAFNRDGNMRYNDCCGCLMGVSFSDVLHVVSSEPGVAHTDNPNHYQMGRCQPGALFAEQGYREIGRSNAESAHHCETLRRDRLSAVLRAEIRRRMKPVVLEMATAIEVEPELVYVRKR